MLFPYSLFALFITLEQQYQDLCYQCLLHGAGLLGNIRLGSFVFFLQIIQLLAGSEGRLINTNKGRGIKNKFPVIIPTIN